MKHKIQKFFYCSQVSQLAIRKCVFDFPNYNSDDTVLNFVKNNSIFIHESNVKVGFCILSYGRLVVEADWDKFELLRIAAASATPRPMDRSGPRGAVRLSHIICV